MRNIAAFVYSFYIRYHARKHSASFARRMQNRNWE